MRVLHLTTHLNIGGITTYILRLSTPMAKRGVETFVVSSGGTCVPEFEGKGARTFRLPIRTKSEIDPKIYFALPNLKKIIAEDLLPDELETISARLPTFAPGEISRALAIIFDNMQRFRKTPIPQLPLELTVLELIGGKRSDTN